MSVQLVVIAGPDKGKQYPLAPGTPFVIGRGRQTNTCLSDLQVSRVHCQIEMRDGKIILTDLNSSTGTLVNGQSITQHTLTSGDTIALGETHLRLVMEDLSDQQTVVPGKLGPVQANPMSFGELDPSHLPVPEFVDTDDEQDFVETELVETGAATPAKGAVFVEPIAEIETPILEEEFPATGPPPLPPIPASKPAPALPTPPSPPPKPALKLPPAKPLTGVAKTLSDLIGTDLSHYRVQEIVARGNSGYVFSAIDLHTSQQVALKVLRPEFSKDDTAVQRFIRGMKTVLPLRHPNLIPVLGAGKKAGFCWIAMEFIEGESLTQVIRRIGIAGMLDWRRAFMIAMDIARALEFAHGHGIIHRNLTPQNVMVRTSDKQALVGDLMLAKAFEGGEAREVTHAGDLVGDVHYLSPERIMGKANIDGRADLYNLGVLLYALLTGHPPFEGQGVMDTLMKIQSEKPASTRKAQMSIPVAFDGLVLCLLAKNPEERVQSATSLLTDLERIGKFQRIL